MPGSTAVEAPRGDHPLRQLTPALNRSGKHNIRIGTYETQTVGSGRVEQLRQRSLAERNMGSACITGVASLYSRSWWLGNVTIRAFGIKPYFSLPMQTKATNRAKR